jgi:hypothetical protein
MLILELVLGNKSDVQMNDNLHYNQRYGLRTEQFNNIRGVVLSQPGFASFDIIHVYYL